MRSKADAVIIGGGIQGTSAAYHLAKKGIVDIAVVEMHFVASGATGGSAAMVMHQTGREPTTRLARLSIQEYDSYAEEFDLDVGFRRVGSICFATDEATANQIRRRVEMQNQHGIETELLEGSALQEKFPPFIETDDILVASYCPLDGYIDPHSVAQAYAGYARREGVEINQYVKALGIRTSGGRVTGVETTSGVIETPVAINAAGALAGQVATWVGIELPIELHMRNIAVFSLKPPPHLFPIVEDVVIEYYFKPEGPNVLVGVGPETEIEGIPDDLPPNFLAPDFDKSHYDAMYAYLSERAPELTGAGIVRGWAGIRAVTPDELPILGPVDELQGLFNCCGWSGFGITLGPIGGLLIAELVKDGTTKDVDLEPFLLKRFQKA